MFVLTGCSCAFGLQSIVSLLIVLAAVDGTLFRGFNEHFERAPLSKRHSGPGGISGLVQTGFVFFPLILFGFVCRFSTLEVRESSIQQVQTGYLVLSKRFAKEIQRGVFGCLFYVP
jgi:hypothetical protein